MTREEHLQWAKNRALEYVERGDLNEAFASMLSDLGKHQELVPHSGKRLMVMLKAGGHLNSAREMREFINGFN
jgi:hypothetical protein